MKEINNPEWLEHLMKSVDNLDFSKKSAFELFDESSNMIFSGSVVFSKENVIDFFKKLDGKLKTKHIITKVWNDNNYYYMQGVVSIIKENGDNIKTPFFNHIWMKESINKKIIEQYVVVLPPKLIEFFK